MVRPRSLAHGAGPTSNRRPRRVRFEGLERRLALAVDCNVTCELSDEQLTVVGSENDDLIEIRYDESTRSLQVLGDGQLLGEYAADAIGSLVVQGLDGNDQLCVDSNLPLACYVDGGEGEDQLQVFSSLTMPTRHGHGGSTSASIFERNIELVTREIISGERDSGRLDDSQINSEPIDSEESSRSTGGSGEGDCSPNQGSRARPRVTYSRPTLPYHTPKRGFCSAGFRSNRPCRRASLPE